MTERSLCTVSDVSYLYKGLTLYESLLRNSKDFVLHYLCIDDDSYAVLKRYENKSLQAYHVKDLVDLLPSVKNGDYSYFCWSLASYFSNFLMNINGQTITYIDSDIFFHKDIDLIFDEIGNKDVGIFRHRHVDNSDFGFFRLAEDGLFNVGVVYFKNSKLGKCVLQWWSDAVMYSKYPQLATCGDQKYLDAFPVMCEENQIFIDGDIGHGAPWQWRLYDFSDYEKNGNIIWEGKKQKLVFSHFSQFVINKSGYIPSTSYYNNTPLEYYSKEPSLKRIYDDYYNEIKCAMAKYT